MEIGGKLRQALQRLRAHGIGQNYKLQKNVTRMYYFKKKICKIISSVGSHENISTGTTVALNSPPACLPAPLSRLLCTPSG